MTRVRGRSVWSWMLAMLLGAATPAFAQVDFTGVWNANTNAEDGPERVAGPSLVEFLGLPINDQARQWGLAYRSGRLSLLEHQCQVHVVHYIHRGPFNARLSYIWRDDWLRNNEGRQFANPIGIWARSEGFVDFQLGYRINEKTSVTLDATMIAKSQRGTREIA